MVRLFSPSGTLSNLTFSPVGAGTIHECVDEPIASADDSSTYAEATVDGDLFSVSLPAIDPPPAYYTDHKIRVRMRSSGTNPGDNGDIYVRLVDDLTVIYESEKVSVTSTWTTHEFDCNLIGAPDDYSTLSIEIEDAGLAAGYRLRVTSIEFEIPGEVLIYGSTDGNSSLSASATMLLTPSGSSAGSSSTTAACVGTGRSTGSSAGLSQVAASLLGSALASGSAAGSSSTTATLSPFWMIVGTADGSSAPAAILLGSGVTAGAAAGVSTAVATIIDASGLGPFEIISNTVRLRFQSQVGTPLPLVTVYDNATPSIVDTDPWCRLEVRMGQCDQIAVGPNDSNLYRKSGEVVASVFTPLGEGDGEALSIASSIVAALRGVTVNETTFETPRVEPGYRDGTRWRVDVRMPFKADFLLERVAGAAPSSLTLEDAAAVVRTRFETEVETGLSVPIQYDGEDDAEHAPTATWCRLALVHGASEAVERVGASVRFRTVGIAYAYLFVPLERGDQSALRLGDQIARAFRAVSDRGVTFRTPLVSGTQRAGAWWQVKVACPFHWDEIA